MRFPSRSRVRSEKLTVPASILLKIYGFSPPSGVGRGNPRLIHRRSDLCMNALPNTRDAIGDSWNSSTRHVRRMARHGRNAAEDIGSELRSLLSELEDTLSTGTATDVAALRAQISDRLDSARSRLNDHARRFPSARGRNLRRRQRVHPRKAVANHCAGSRPGARRRGVAGARPLAAARVIHGWSEVQPISLSKKSGPIRSMRSVQIASTLLHCASSRARAGSFTVYARMCKPASLISATTRSSSAQ